MHSVREHDNCIFSLYVQMSRPSIILKLILGLLWTITHLAISLLNLWSHLIYSLECYLISSGLLRKYQNLHLGRLKCLAIVVDSKEAKSTAKFKQLLCWFSSMGVKYVCLYDIEGKTMSSTFELQGMAVYSLKFVVDYLSTYMIIPFL
jgi:ditrans,polycis-polyprenyl diphosphate synthase